MNTEKKKKQKSRRGTEEEGQGNSTSEKSKVEASAPGSAAPASEEGGKAPCRVHRCRFVPWVPHAVIALSFDSTRTRLAVGRDNGDIELWRLHSPGMFFQCERKLPGTGEDTLTGLCWVPSSRGRPDRLFSVGLHGRLLQWDLHNLRVKHSVESGGGAIWEIALHSYSPKQRLLQQRSDQSQSSRQEVVLACDDGSLRIFDLSDEFGKPEYKRALLMHQKRALSVSWVDDFLVSGGADGTIRIWDVESGRNTIRMTVDSTAQQLAEEEDQNKKNKGRKRGEDDENDGNSFIGLDGSVGKIPGETGKNGRPKNLVTMVWEVKVLSDCATIVSGDSLGHVQFWDCKFGTLLQSFATHKADVLSLCIVQQPYQQQQGAVSQDVVYASGVDSIIAEYRRIESTRRWVLSGCQRATPHDVNALTVGYISARPANSTNSPNPYASDQYKLGLIAGGVDTQLIVFGVDDFRVKKPHKLSPFPQKTVVHPAGKGGKATGDERIKFLVELDNQLQVWETGYTSSTSNSSSSEAAQEESNSNLNSNSNSNLNGAVNFQLAASYDHLLSLNVKEKSGEILNLISSSFSKDAQFIAASTPLELRLYHLSYAHSKPPAKKPLGLPNGETTQQQQKKKVSSCSRVQLAVNAPASMVCFTPDSRHLISAGLDARIVVTPTHQNSAGGSGEGGEVSGARALVFTAHRRKKLAQDVHGKAIEEIRTHRASKKAGEDDDDEENGKDENEEGKKNKRGRPPTKGKKGGKKAAEQEDNAVDKEAVDSESSDDDDDSNELNDRAPCYICTLASSPCGKFAASGDNAGRIFLHDLSSSLPLITNNNKNSGTAITTQAPSSASHSLPRPDYPHYLLSFLSPSVLAAVCVNYEVVLYDTQNLSIIRTVVLPMGPALPTRKPQQQQQQEQQQQQVRPPPPFKNTNVISVTVDTHNDVVKVMFASQTTIVTYALSDLLAGGGVDTSSDSDAHQKASVKRQRGRHSSIPHTSIEKYCPLLFSGLIPTLPTSASSKPTTKVNKKTPKKQKKNREAEAEEVEDDDAINDDGSSATQEMLVVEIPWLKLREEVMPRPLYRHKYGIN